MEKFSRVGIVGAAFVLLPGGCGANWMLGSDMSNGIVDHLVRW